MYYVLKRRFLVRRNVAGATSIVEAEVCKLLSTLRSSSKMLLDVINDVLDLSKIESRV
jgi:signal transduction histidine kinase